MLPFSDLDLLRLHSILGMGAPTPTVAQPQSDSPANDRLGQVLGQYPQRPKPSTMDKVRGNIAYFGSSRPAGMWGGVPVGFEINSRDAEESKDNAMYGNYNRQVEDWTNQVKPVEYAANQERLYQGLDARNRDITRKENKDENDKKIAEEKLDVRRQELKRRMDADALHGTKFFIQKDGSILAAHPNGTSGRIDANVFTPKDIQEMKTTGMIQEIEAREKGQEKLEGIKEGNRQKDIKARVQGQKDVKATPSAGKDVDTTTTTTVDETGKTKVVTKEKGITVRMIGPDGQEYDVPKEKVQEAVQQHHMKVK